jgi:hypothetical protein
MKQILLVFILLFPLVVADVSINCETDNQCKLFTGNDIAKCQDSNCFDKVEKSREMMHEYFLMKNGDVDWEVLNVYEEQKNPLACKSKGCLNFAPQFAAPLDGFFRWLLYAKPY